MANPLIATILDNGEYGEREMTDVEYAEYLETVSHEPPYPDTSPIPHTAQNE